MSRPLPNPDVVVIGAGAVGCSVAYQLAGRGKSVTLLDQRAPGTGTSATNFGLVWVQSKQPHSYMEFSLASSRLWPGLVDELGEAVGLRQGGGLTLCLTDDDIERQQAIIDAQSVSPQFEGRMLSPQEVFDIQPAVSRDILARSGRPTMATSTGSSGPARWHAAVSTPVSTSARVRESPASRPIPTTPSPRSSRRADALKPVPPWWPQASGPHASPRWPASTWMCARSRVRSWSRSQRR